jgi:hypothetical protein
MTWTLEELRTAFRVTAALAPSAAREILTHGPDPLPAALLREDWAPLLGVLDEAGVANCLLRIPSARAAADVRGALRELGGVPVLRDLLRDAEPDEFREVFRTLATVAPKIALQILEDQDCRGPLRPVDLAGLFAASDPHIRRRAAHWLGVLAQEM